MRSERTSVTVSSRVAASSVTKVDLAHSKERMMAEEKNNRTSAGCIFRRGLCVDRDRDGPGTQRAGRAGILSSLAAVAHRHQLCSELLVHRHHLD